MNNRQTYISVIIKRLNYLKNEVATYNSLNLTDINVHAENFYRDFLNLFGFKFENTNYIQQNFAHIDLIDHEKKLAIQVTSQNDNKKIKASVDGFYKNSENRSYKLKILLISKEAKNYRTKFGDNFNHKEDILDINKIIAQINDLKDIGQIKNIADFLDEHVLLERKRTESSEVETIMALIEYLSMDNNRIISQKPENVDPHFKFYKRFSEHSEFLIANYNELCTIYHQPLIEAKKEIDTVKAIKITSYLKDESDKILNETGNNAKLALEKLVDFFYGKLSRNGFKFDKMAIKYYLLEELIICNVFPNN